MQSSDQEENYWNWDDDKEMRQKKNDSHQVPLTLCLRDRDLDLRKLYQRYWVYFLNK